MLINNIKSITYWRKTYPVEAIRLTPYNMQAIADYLGAEYYDKLGTTDANISHNGEQGFVGEWIVYDKDSSAYLFYSHEEFSKAYKTHSEEMATDDRYAKIFQLVASAMAKQDAATYNQDQTGMDFLAIETVKRIIGEL